LHIEIENKIGKKYTGCLYSSYISGQAHYNLSCVKCAIEPQPTNISGFNISLL